MFPAQVLDILLICAANTTEYGTEEIVRKISNSDLAKAMMEYAFKILTEETLSVNMINAKRGLINVLVENHLL